MSLGGSRRSTITHYGWGELLWADHILYGNPALRLVEKAGGRVSQVTQLDDSLLAPVTTRETAGEEPVVLPHATMREKHEVPQAKKKSAVVSLLLAAIMAGGIYLGLKVLNGKTAIQPSIEKPAGDSSVSTHLESPVEKPSGTTADIAETKADLPSESAPPQPKAPVEEPSYIFVDIREVVDGSPSQKNVTGSFLENSFVKEGLKILEKEYPAPETPSLGDQIRNAMARQDRERLSALGREHGVRIAVIGRAECLFLKTDNLMGTIFYVYTTDLDVKVIDTMAGKIIGTKTVHVNKGAQSKQTAGTVSLKAAAEEISHALVSEIIKK